MTKSSGIRALGIDLGSKRIGVAVSDLSGNIAGPLTVVQRSGSEKRDHQTIRQLVIDEEAEIIVVGLPLTMAGEIGRAAQAAVAETKRLATVVDVPVVTFDERLTTVSAERTLLEANMNAQARRRVVDKVAAAVMLQSWLDERQHRLKDSDNG